MLEQDTGGGKVMTGGVFTRQNRDCRQIRVDVRKRDVRVGYYICMT